MCIEKISKPVPIENEVLIRVKLGEEKVIALCGSPIIVAQGAKMYWWKQHFPEVFARVNKFVPASTYICGCMAGLKAKDAYIDYTHIHLTCFADVEHNVWSKELLTLFDFPEEKLPKIVAPFDVIGAVTREWAEVSGLCEGTPIVAGCGDTAASTLGAGLVHENMVLDVAGTASVFTVCVSEYRPDTEKKILIYPRSILPGLWTPFGFVLGGETMNWYHDQVNYDGAYSFETLANATVNVENDGLFFLPYFAGRICPSDASFSGHWLGLKFYHGREHMFKSVMESVAYEYRFYLNRILELFPELKTEEIMTVAGGSRSNAFIQIKADERILDYFSIDIRRLFAKTSNKYPIHFPDGTFQNEWGILQRQGQFGVEFVKHPLEDAEIEDLENYPWPKAEELIDLRGMKERAKKLHEENQYAISLRAPMNGIFEISCWLREMQNFLIDMLSDEEFAHALTEKVLEVQMDWYGYVLDEVGPYVDIVETGDDYGTQNSLMISPECLEEFILSRRKRLNDMIKEKAPNAKIFLHCCGSIKRCIPNLIACGVDVLNPVQTVAVDMDPYDLKREFGDQICFHGGVDTQKALRGTVQDVEAEVKKMLDAMNHKGGYILTSCNHIQNDIPVENIVAMFEAAKKYSSV